MEAGCAVKDQVVKAGLLVVAPGFERHEGISQAAVSPPVVISVLNSCIELS